MDSLVDQLTSKFNPPAQSSVNPNSPTVAYAAVNEPLEYNDEYYYSVGEGAIHANKLYVGVDGKAKAQAQAEQENIAFMKDVSYISEYTYDSEWEGILAHGYTEETFLARFNEIMGTDYEDIGDAMSHSLSTYQGPKLTDEQARQLAEILDLPGMSYVREFTLTTS